jgi:excisionase family DNA binding protein
MVYSELETLAAVTTPKEGGPLVGVTQRTVIRWCNEGKVAYRRSGSTYLILLDSLKRYAHEGIPAHDQQ